MTGQILIILLFSWLTADSTGNDMIITDLSCQYQTNPLGIEEHHPVLGWKMQSNIRGQKQTAYQILVASSPDRLKPSVADLWNSGKVISDQSVTVPYRGKRLKSRQKCFWKVKVWDREGKASGISLPAFWEMGLLDEKDWQARWLRHPSFPDTLYKPRPAPFFRKHFTVDKEISSARAYVTGLGYFEMYINGKKVGDHVLDPVKTRYDKHIKYLVFDVGDYLNDSENAMGLVLGTGWFNHFARSAWQFNLAPWRAYPAMLCQLEIRYKDGTTLVISSDRTWKCSQGPILYDGIRNGEHYDARREMPGWSQPWFDDREWLPAVEVPSPGGKRMAQQLPAIKEMREIRPVSVDETGPGVYVFDLGQNIAGYSRIRVAGPKGTEIVLKHGEKLHPDGRVEQKQILRFLKTGKAQTDIYTLKGEGIETWNPRFVYHGFQYVEVSGLPVKPGRQTLTGVVVHTSFEPAGGFACSNPLLNRIQELTRWSYIGNYHGIPTDCPHREKIGWTGDGHLVAEAGLYNYHVATSYIKWLDDFVAAQRKDGSLPSIVPTSGWGYGDSEVFRGNHHGPQWHGAFMLIGWCLYEYTGDTAIIERFYEPVLKYMDYLNALAVNNLLDVGIDDHKAIGTQTEPGILSSAYYYRLTRLAAKMSAVAQKEDQSAIFSEKAGKIKKAFNRKYFDRKTNTYGNGGQTSMALALALGLVPEKYLEPVLRGLCSIIVNNDHHFDAGVVGVKSIFNASDDPHYSNIVYQMLNHRDFPGYAWWIDQGANTLWQDWDGSMSLNHVMFGSVSEWFYQTLVGINPDPEQPGFKHVIIKPAFIDDLKWVNAEHEGPFGTISSGWSREGERVILRVQVPVNTSATVYLPGDFQVKDREKFRYTGRNRIHIPSGRYAIECKKTGL